MSAYALNLIAASSQYASITDAAQTGLDVTGDMSFECWVKLSSQPASGGTYVFGSKYLSTGNKRSWSFLYYNDGGTYKLWANLSANGTAVSQPYATHTLTTGEWHHVAFTVDVGTATAIYVDGVALSMGSSAAPASLYDSDMAFIIGAENAGAASLMDGVIDEVRVWSDVRTATEIGVNFDKELVGNETNLVGYWQLENDYLDLTANNNDLTASGSPTFSTSVRKQLPLTTALPQSGSIIARLKLNEGGGTRYDSVGANHFTDNNSVLSATGLAEAAAGAEKSADFESGNSEYLNIADNAALSITGDMSQAAWINIESLPSNAEYMLFGKSLHTGDQCGTLIQLTKYNSAQAGISAGAEGVMTTMSVNGADTVTKGLDFGYGTATWVHFAWVYDASEGTVKVFKDGAQVGSTLTGFPTSQYNNTAGFFIGKYEGGSSYLDGKVQDALVWNCALTDEEISSLYSAYTTVPSTASETKLNRTPIRGVGRGIMRP